MTGNFLLLTSLAIVLCSVVASYGNLADTEWYTHLTSYGHHAESIIYLFRTERDEQAFNELCTRLTEFEHTLRVLWNMAVRYRQTKPLKVRQLHYVRTYVRTPLLALLFFCFFVVVFFSSMRVA